MQDQNQSLRETPGMTNYNPNRVLTCIGSAAGKEHCGWTKLFKQWSLTCPLC